MGVSDQVSPREYAAPVEDFGTGHIAGSTALVIASPLAISVRVGEKPA